DRAFPLIRLGRWRDARTDACESILVASRVGWRENVAYCLVALAAVAVAANEDERAARFLGQADQIAEEVRLEFQAYADQIRVETREALRYRLPSNQLDSLLAEGRAWSVDQAVAAAVDPPYPESPLLVGAACDVHQDLRPRDGIEIVESRANGPLGL